MFFAWSLLFACFAYWCVFGLTVAFAIVLVIAVFLLLFLLFVLFADLSDCKATTNEQISSVLRLKVDRVNLSFAWS